MGWSSELPTDAILHTNEAKRQVFLPKINNNDIRAGGVNFNISTCWRSSPNSENLKEKSVITTMSTWSVQKRVQRTNVKKRFVSSQSRKYSYIEKLRKITRYCLKGKQT